MSKYIDSFIIPVPKNKIDEYKKLAQISAKVWKDHGALEYIECIADDAPIGETTSFPRSVDLKTDEIVILAFISYKDREHRDQVNKKCLEDSRLAYMTDLSVLPFDSKRMIVGGFQSFIS